MDNATPSPYGPVSLEMTGFAPTRNDESVTQRRGQRFQPDVKRAIFQDPVHGPIQSETVDESFGGIGIRFNRRPSLQPGQELRIGYNGIQMWAIVRHITVDEDDTCQIGFEWKGAGLSQRARQATGERCRSLQGDNAQCPPEKARFFKMIPGGVYMMWSLFEAESFFELGEASSRLGRQAEKLSFDDVVANARQLQEAIERESNPEYIRVELEAMVESCIAVCKAG